jgi:hypothetical protein
VKKFGVYATTAVGATAVSMACWIGVAAADGYSPDHGVRRRPSAMRAEGVIAAGQ